MTESAHSLLSPSSAPRWMRCPGSVALSDGVPDTSSDYADEGTAAHHVAARCLIAGHDAERWIGEQLHVFDDGSVVNGPEPQVPEPRYSCTVDVDFARHVQRYVDTMRKLIGLKLYEQRVNYSPFIGVDESTGTSDTVVLEMTAERIEAHDLKFGKGVIVYASWMDAEGVNTYPNEQLALYLLGAVNDADILADWKTFVIGVHQPRIGDNGHTDTFEMTREQLMAFAQSARAAAAEAMSGFAVAMGKREPLPYDVLDLAGLIRPGWKQCMFCPAGKAGRCAKKYVRQPPHKGKAAADADFGPPVELSNIEI